MTLKYFDVKIFVLSVFKSILTIFTILPHNVYKRM